MMTIRLRPIRIAYALGIGAFLLVSISLGLQLMKYVAGHDYVYGLFPVANHLFNVEEERNITTLFSVCLLLCAAVLLAVITSVKQHLLDPERSRWAVLSVGFLCLATDEAWSFHETLTEPMRGLVGADNLSYFFHFAWVVPALTGVLTVGLLFSRFLLRLPSTTRLYFVGAGFLYLGGAIGVETISGIYATTHGLENLTYQLMIHAEESLEMAGSILFVYALLCYLADQYSAVQFLIDASRQEDKTVNYALTTRKSPGPDLFDIRPASIALWRRIALQFHPSTTAAANLPENHSER